MSKVRQNYHEETEAGVNKTLNLILRASYTYMSMSSHFDRDDVALPGLSSFFHESSNRKRSQAVSLMRIQNKRGGRLVMADIKKPELDDWGDGIAAMGHALDLEKTLNDSFLVVHSIAAKHTDAHLEDYIEDEYLQPQVETIKQLSDYMRQMTRAGAGLGEYVFDRELLEKS